jgi:hypothetical protein
LENAAQIVEEVDKKTGSSLKRFINWKFSIGSVVAGALVFGGISLYQTHHFNARITINGINVGELTADQALQKLESSMSKNEVYLGQEKIFDGKDTKIGFTKQDLSGVQKLFTSQRTFFPSLKAENYLLVPREGNYQSQKMEQKEIVNQKLIDMNKSLKATQDAEAHLEQGKIFVSKSINGKDYDIERLLQQYQSQEYNSEIHLNPVYVPPVQENSPIIKKEEQMLQALLQRTVNYKVQNKVYSLKASDLIKQASVTKNMQYTIDSTNIKNELNKINESQSTLNKNFQFKTHSGKVVSVKGQTYGWVLNVGKEAQQIQAAFAKGQSSVVASNVHGNGWYNDAIGFNNTTNNGIGDTYAEVSIAEQRIWLYRNGQMVLTTNVVTGRHDVGEDTHPGVWYILYKRSPYLLKGSEVGLENYRVPVSYWDPFTNDGQGFHDAGWRTNWSSTAYLHQGSGGCVNTPSSAMGSVYKILSVYEPVIVY